MGAAWLGWRHRLVARSGAGVQEALLLSVLLVNADGKVVVLDESALNLEPTVQRRLLRRLRSPGQRLVITHHADLVPVEEPADWTGLSGLSQDRRGRRYCVRTWDSSGLPDCGG